MSREGEDSEGATARSRVSTWCTGLPFVPIEQSCTEARRGRDTGDGPEKTRDGVVYTVDSADEVGGIVGIVKGGGALTIRNLFGFVASLERRRTNEDAVPLGLPGTRRVRDAKSPAVARSRLAGDMGVAVSRRGRGDSAVAFQISESASTVREPRRLFRFRETQRRVLAFDADEPEVAGVTLKVKAAVDDLADSDLLLRMGIRLGGRALFKNPATL
ncbi:hypothetical protein C8Q73DRAFT_364221 [Cubamyces lactineus]|nr:hypothetical protein C8Q73DRAFT_364221 [Cubamyces lactineus]